MSEFNNLRSALKATKIKLDAKQQAELERRQWLDEMSVSMGERYIGEVQKRLQAQAEAFREQWEAMEQQYRERESLLQRRMEQLEQRISDARYDDTPLIEALHSIRIPETDLSPVMREIEQLKGEKAAKPKGKRPKRNYVFEVQRDQNGMITQIFADEDDLDETQSWDEEARVPQGGGEDLGWGEFGEEGEHE